MQKSFMIMRLNESGDWVQVDGTTSYDTRAEAEGTVNTLDFTGSGYYPSGPGNTVCVKIEECFNVPTS